MGEERYLPGNTPSCKCTAAAAFSTSAAGPISVLSQVLAPCPFPSPSPSPRPPCPRARQAVSDEGILLWAANRKADLGRSSAEPAALAVAARRLVEAKSTADLLAWLEESESEGESDDEDE